MGNRECFGDSQILLGEEVIVEESSEPYKRMIRRNHADAVKVGRHDGLFA
jgi:hypothetical protein